MAQYEPAAQAAGVTVLAGQYWPDAQATWVLGVAQYEPNAHGVWADELVGQ